MCYRIILFPNRCFLYLEHGLLWVSKPVFRRDVVSFLCRSECRKQGQKNNLWKLILQPGLYVLHSLKESFGVCSSVWFHLLWEIFRCQAAAWHLGLMDPLVFIVPVAIVPLTGKLKVQSLLVYTSKFSGSSERKEGRTGRG